MRLYVGNISFKATEDDLRELFSQAGEVVNVKLIEDAATGRLRGFGFVEMASQEAGKKAIEMFNGQQVMERSIVVNEAKPQEKRTPGSGGFKSRGSYGDKRGERR